MSEKSSTAGGGVGFTGLLTLLFVALKLLGKIDWSWWWVLSPVWISVGVALAFLVLLVVVAVIGSFLK